MIEFDTKLVDKPAMYANDRLHFFKYMSAETAKIVLQNRTLRWSTAAELNDPFEMIFDTSLNGDKTEIRDAALDQLWSLYTGGEPIKALNDVGRMFEYIRVNIPDLKKDALFEEFGAAIDKGLAIIEANAGKSSAELMPVFASIKILSLTQRPDIALMWAHYTNSHKGVVLRFRSIPALNSPYGMAKPVRYEAAVPMLFSESYLINAFCGVETLGTGELMDRILYRKSPHWAYEEEWRISAGDGRDADKSFEDVTFGKNELDGVIFGMKTSDADRTDIRALADMYPNVEYMQASAIPNTDVLDINVIQ